LLYKYFKEIVLDTDFSILQEIFMTSKPNLEIGYGTAQGGEALEVESKRPGERSSRSGTLTLRGPGVCLGLL
jgi:cephalosporin hydroxylase